MSAALRAGDTGRARAAQRGQPMTDSEFELQLLDDMAAFYDDPVGWVYYSFDWGRGELSDYDGPDQLQIALM